MASKGDIQATRSTAAAGAAAIIAQPVRLGPENLSVNKV